MERYLQPEISIYRCEYETDCFYWNYNNVSAPYWRFYWCASPGGEMFYKQEKIIPRADSFIMIPPDTCFSTQVTTSFEQLYIHFVADPPFDRVRQNIYVFEMQECILSKILSLKEIVLAGQTDMHFRLLLFGLIYEALLEIPREAFVVDNSSYDPRIIKITKLLDENTAWVYSNEELAQMVNMSVNGFIRLFSRDMGISPLQYSRQKRIQKACLLLHFSKQSIDEIARNTGFQDRYYFSRVFKQITNHSPAQYRKLELPI